jgi:L-threonylcarbamoyladenylate synthase
MVAGSNVTPKSEDIARAARILLAGGLVAFPTETVYGLGALALDPTAIARIFAAKGRPEHHPLIAHVLDSSQAVGLASDWPPFAVRLSEAFWPGPLTLVVPRGRVVPLALTGGGPSVALRAPAHPMARELLAAVGQPIAAPSANRYQSVSPTTAAHVKASLGDRVDMILDGGSCSAGIESTVVDVRGSEPVVLRPGSIDLPTLARVVPTVREAHGSVAEDRSVRASPGLDRRHYAPKATLVIAETAVLAEQEAQSLLSRGKRVALLRVTDEGSTDDGVLVRCLGADAATYARALFAVLHELDARGIDTIVAEPVPNLAEWRGVADRLARASTAL